MIDIQRLSELHAATTQGAWHQCGANNGKCPCGLVWSVDADTVVANCHGDDDAPNPLPYEQEIANGNWMAESHNQWPAVAAELTRLREFARDCRDNYDCDLNAHQYNTRCRACEAARLLDDEIKKAGE